MTSSIDVMDDRLAESGSEAARLGYPVEFLERLMSRAQLSGVRGHPSEPGHVPSAGVR
jgi:hypothetical protein